MEATNGLKALAQLIMDTREAKGLSMRKLAQSAGLTHSFIAKLEAGQFQTVSPRSLDAIARALELPREDLFSLAGYNVPDELPTFGPYLRARYGAELPDHAMTALDELFEALREKYTGSDEVDDEDHPSDDRQYGGRS